MRATLPSEPTFNGRNYGAEKEIEQSYLLIGVGKSRSDVVELATLRIYVGRSKSASRVYASLWVHGKCAGHGWAGGGGYHKGSAAAGKAFESAGIDLDSDISGRGEKAIEDALLAVGLALDYHIVRVFTA